MSEVDVAILQETTCSNGDDATTSQVGYKIHTAVPGNKNCWGISLLIREDDTFITKSTNVVEPKIFAFEMFMRRFERWCVLGCYSSLSNQDGEGVKASGGRVSQLAKVVMSPCYGDLDINLDFPWDRQEEIISATIQGRGLGGTAR